MWQSLTNARRLLFAALKCQCLGRCPRLDLYYTILIAYDVGSRHGVFIMPFSYISGYFFEEVPSTRYSAITGSQFWLPVTGIITNATEQFLWCSSELVNKAAPGGRSNSGRQNMACCRVDHSHRQPVY